MKRQNETNGSEQGKKRRKRKNEISNIGRLPTADPEQPIDTLRYEYGEREAEVLAQNWYVIKQQCSCCQQEQRRYLHNGFLVTVKKMTFLTVTRIHSLRYRYLHNSALVAESLRYRYLHNSALVANKNIGTYITALLLKNLCVLVPT